VQNEQFLAASSFCRGSYTITTGSTAGRSTHGQGKSGGIQARSTPASNVQPGQQQSSLTPPIRGAQHVSPPSNRSPPQPVRWQPSAQGGTGGRRLALAWSSWPSGVTPPLGQPSLPQSHWPPQAQSWQQAARRSTLAQPRLTHRDHNGATSSRLWTPEDRKLEKSHITDIQQKQEHFRREKWGQGKGSHSPAGRVFKSLTPPWSPRAEQADPFTWTACVCV
jgi:hypothetical protein